MQPFSEEDTGALSFLGVGVGHYFERKNKKNFPTERADKQQQKRRSSHFVGGGGGDATIYKCIKTIHVIGAKGGCAPPPPQDLQMFLYRNEITVLKWA